MHLSIERVCWVDNYFNIYTTIVVCGLFYTFEGEIDEEDLSGTVATIFDRLESHEEDGATLEMSDTFSKVQYKDVLDTIFIIN